MQLFQTELPLDQRRLYLYVRCYLIALSNGFKWYR